MWSRYFRVETLPEYGATVAELFADAGMKNVKTWRLGGLATPAFSYLVGDVEDGDRTRLLEFPKVGRDEFKWGIVNDFTLPTWTQGQVGCE